jgi:hypothetical protein
LPIGPSLDWLGVDYHISWTSFWGADHVATLLVGLSLGVGMAGYHYFEGLAWIDAFANAAMILSGMGPLNPMQTWGGKLFAGLYALYSGLVLIAATTIILAPIVHRLLHHFHVAEEQRDSSG